KGDAILANKRADSPAYADALASGFARAGETEEAHGAAREDRLLVGFGDLRVHQEAEGSAGVMLRVAAPEKETVGAERLQDRFQLAPVGAAGERLQEDV